jgi:ubiquinone/menaquinone biosynthesis C-methylase UbiE
MNVFDANMKDRAKAQFERWAQSYDRSLLHHFLFRASYVAQMEEIARWYAEREGPFRVLDVGCGTGELPAMLARSSWPVQAVGLDYSPAMCRAAAAKVHETGLPGCARYLAADSESLPFADGSFDVVTCANSFHHYPHQLAVVRGVRRVLRPGGRFVLIDGFRDNVVGWVAFDVIVSRIEKGVHHAPWSVIDGYFRSGGFQNIRRRKINFWMPLCVTIGDAD